MKEWFIVCTLISKWLCFKEINVFEGFSTAQKVAKMFPLIRMLYSVLKLLNYYSLKKEKANKCVIILTKLINYHWGFKYLMCDCEPKFLFIFCLISKAVDEIKKTKSSSNHNEWLTEANKWVSAHTKDFWDWANFLRINYCPCSAVSPEIHTNNARTCEKVMFFLSS